MAVNGITNSDSMLISALSRRARVLMRPVSTQPSALNQVPAAIPAPRAVEPILQNLQSSSVPLPNATPPVDAIVQNMLLMNENLGRLDSTSAEPQNPLLIDVIPPTLEAVGITGNLTVIQQNLLFMNETLQNIGSASFLATGQQGVEGVIAPPIMTVMPTIAGGAGETAPAVPAIDRTLAAAVPEVVAVTPTTTAGVEVGLPVSGMFLTQELTPTTQPAVLFPDRTPYVLVVYLINDPAPPPSSRVEPIDVDVTPTAAVAEILAVGNARLRQAQFRKRARAQTGTVEYNETLNTVEQAERSIRYSLDRVNADMAAHNRPFHLVFARHGDNFALDVYDSSFSDASRMMYDVPIALDKLTVVLDNLEHETGIIVDTDS